MISVSYCCSDGERNVLLLCGLCFQVQLLCRLDKCAGKLENRSHCRIMAELQIAHYLASMKANSSACLAKRDTHTQQSYTSFMLNTHILQLHCGSIFLYLLVYAFMDVRVYSSGVSEWDILPKDEQKLKRKSNFLMRAVSSLNKMKVLTQVHKSLWGPNNGPFNYICNRGQLLERRK